MKSLTSLIASVLLCVGCGIAKYPALTPGELVPVTEEVTRNTSVGGGPVGPSTPAVIEIVLGVQPDYFTFIESSGSRERYIQASNDLIKTAVVYPGLVEPTQGVAFNHGWQKATRHFVPFNQYQETRIKERLALEQKRKLLDLFYGAMLREEVKALFPGSTVILRLEDQSLVMARARNAHNAWPRGGVKTFTASGANDPHLGYWDINAIFDYVDACLFGLSQPSTTTSIPNAIRLNLTTFSKLRPHATRSEWQWLDFASFGYQACFLVTAHAKESDTEIYSSANLSSAKSEAWVKELSRFSAKRYVKDQMLERPVSSAWTNWWFGEPGKTETVTSMTPFSLVEEAWNYPLAYCSFLPDPKESDPKNVVRYALSRIAADIYRASSPRATDSANTGLEAQGKRI